MKLLKDDKGKLRNFSQFRKASQPIIGKYNRSWLRTEYNTAVSRAHHAANWQQYEAEKDVLPNLEWVESTSSHPGADHAIFWGTIQPVDSPFWSEHRPGDRWNCQCSLKQTDKTPTIAPNADSRSIPQPGLENNPGIDGKLFNESHPYYPKSCSLCPFAYNKLKALFQDLTDNRKCHKCKAIDNAITGIKITERRTEFFNMPDSIEKTFFDKNTGGYVVTDKERIAFAKINKQELAKYNKEKNMCINYAKAGYVMKHLKEVPRVSSPDVIFNGKKADLKSLSSHNNILRHAKEAIKKQNAEIVLFEFTKRTGSIIDEIHNLSKIGIHGFYYFSDNPKAILRF